MGASLVSAALVYVCPVLGRNHSARVAVVTMANMALDQDRPPLYFGGWQPIAHALGLNGTAESQRDRVTKVVRQLEDASAVRLYDSRTADRPDTYELMLPSWPHLTLVDDGENPVDRQGARWPTPGRYSRVDPALTAGFTRP